jgi:hypothetical protein
MTRGLLVLMALVAAVASADVPGPKPRPRAVCQLDSDCVVSDFKGCCVQECCPTGPKAWVKAQLQQAQASCARKRCELAPACEATPCAPRGATDLVAVCEGGQCVAVSGPRRDDPDFCGSDAECVSSTFAGCCGSCCPVAPRAVTRQRASLESLECGDVHCGQRDCSRIACAQMVPSPIRPVCRGNRCVAERPEVVPVPPPPSECRVDADCGLDQSPPPGSACWESACGCCPVARAVPASLARPAPTRRTPKGSTPFGLTQGSSVSPTCAPCPAVSSVTPRCQSGRCVGGVGAGR